MIKEARKRESIDKVSFLTVNEKRRAINMPPIKDGDALLLRTSDVLVPIEYAKELGLKKARYIEKEIAYGSTKEEANALAEIIWPNI